MKIIFLILLIFLFGSCADLANQVAPRSAIGGAVGGAVLKSGIDKAREVFTPHYKLLNKPIEVCDISNKTEVTCHLIPCKSKVCDISYPAEEFFTRNPKIQTIRSSAFSAIKQFCLKNKDDCMNYQAEYSGKKIVILE